MSIPWRGCTSDCSSSFPCSTRSPIDSRSTRPPGNDADIAEPSIHRTRSSTASLIADWIRSWMQPNPPMTHCRPSCPCRSVTRPAAPGTSWSEPEIESSIGPWRTCRRRTCTYPGPCPAQLPSRIRDRPDQRPRVSTAPLEPGRGLGTPTIAARTADPLRVRPPRRPAPHAVHRGRRPLVPGAPWQ